MYQELLRKIAEEKPSYHEEEIQWLLDHLGDPSPEIRDDLVFTSFARGIQEEDYIKRLIRYVCQPLNVLLRRLFMQISCLQMPTSNRFFIRD